MHELEDRIKYTFKNRSLLDEALTHRSFGTPNNERLEFLGDAVLNLVIGRYLFERHNDLPEGELTRVRSVLVDQDGLTRISIDLDLGNYLKLGAGEQKTGGSERPSILSDAVEALFGAIYIDSGFESVERVIQYLYSSYLENTDPRELSKDPKTKLQEFLQGMRLGLPDYQVIDILGEAHDQEFVVECRVSTFDVAARGNGRSRRSAEQEAAGLAYKLISEREA
ncbi:MAG: ribonuclease III [Proteobacteria bacterium]|nr:ribonuclease III [Pseudomonadota bacterium]MDA0861946.1 ribonuclease III [Pseudomonadota bacterium]MDA1030053.1 ribonuclease III [Pseudomonadota bacterium]